MSFAIGIGVLIGILALGGLASAWLQNKLGVISLAHAAVLGVGAYAYAQATVSGMPPWAGMLLGTCTGTVAGTLLVELSNRLHGDDFALATFAIQIIFVGIAANATPLTGGPLGISNISRVVPAELLGSWVAALIWASLLVFMLLISCVNRSAFSAGCAVVTRSNELALTLGASPKLIRRQVGALYGAMLGLAGCTLATYLTFVDPTLFLIGTSVTMLAIGFFVKRNKVSGVVLGAALLIGVPEMVRLLGISPAQSGYLQLLMSGIVVVVVATKHFTDSPPR